MFPTFTGASRRPRNVDLSGHRNTNPWANSGWASTPSGASQTVAHAQAERERRQREREEVAAAKRLQRVWRGHKGRQKARRRHRTEWDALYKHTSSLPPSADNATKLLLLLVALFDPSDAEDQRRVDLLIQVLSTVGLDSVETRQWNKLVPLLVAALERRPTDSSQGPLNLLKDVVTRRPSTVDPVSDRYYRLLVGYCRQSRENGEASSFLDDQQHLAEVISAPLASSPWGESDNPPAYEAFVSSFLTSADLLFLESNPSLIAGMLNLQLLSKSVVEVFAHGGRIDRTSKDGLLWLLSHYIALNRAIPTSQGGLYLEALYHLLSVLAADIRMRSGLDEEDDDDSSDERSAIKDASPLPSYVMEQLEFLVDEDGINELLIRFTTTSLPSERMSEDASLLAGYTLILLRCFPSHADDIKMRLFQGDIYAEGPATSVPMPTVRYFWKAASRTEVFSTILQIQARQRPTSIVTLLQPDAVRDQEWRTILLFLELYNFLLRVTDDEDFLQSDNEVTSDQSTAVMRIRSSGLSLGGLKDLISFLKNLSFPLYYNLSDIMPSPARPNRLRNLMGVGSSKTSTPNTAEKLATPSFAGIMGMDVLTLRTAATATMRSLYERDSRRPFLPQDFWLMTSKFDMDGFISAVVLEEQRKDEAAEEDDDEWGDTEMNDTDAYHTSMFQRLSRAAQIERQRQLRRVQREQLLAQVGPKLEILRNMPFTIPFDVRVQIFRQFVHLDKLKRRGGFVDPDRWRLSMIGFDPALGASARGRDILGRHTARIKRGQVFEDAYDQFYTLGESLKEPIQITFVDKFDQPEAGIDGGGVTKEFLISVTDEAFDPSPDGHGLFVTNSQNLLYPNPTAFDELAERMRLSGTREGSPEWADHMSELSRRYEFLGRIVGKCMYEGILVDIAFASFFLLKWSSAGQNSANDFRGSLNELRDLDPDLYRGLINLKKYPGDVADLALDFTITDQFTIKETGEVKTITRPLRKDGENMPVTNQGRPLYISYVAHHRLVAQPYRQTKAFLRGLGSIINPSWLSMFNQSELQRLVGGDSSEIDVEDLRANTIYSGLYAIGEDGLEHPTVQMFWQVMHELKDAERREVLKYVTSTPRAPLLGFSQLSPHFSIRDGGDDEERLPSTSTCVNLLKLPRYKTVETLRAKLLYAIESGAGFDLS